MLRACVIVLVALGALPWTAAHAAYQPLPKVLDPNAGANDRFGYGVDLSGDTLVAGAPFDDGLSRDEGSAAVFRLVGDTWHHEASLIPPYTRTDALFGWSVAIDGDTIAVGAPAAVDGWWIAGAVFIYTRNDGVWSWTQTIAPGTKHWDYVGWSVALQGDTLVIGAPGTDRDTPQMGSAYVYRRTGSAWVEEARLVPSGGTGTPFMGASVALHGDTVVAGAPYDAVRGTRSGAAFVFSRSGSGWSQQGKIVPSQLTDGDTLGHAVAVHGDTLMVGAPRDESMNTVLNGAVYVYTRDGNTWTQRTRLRPDGSGLYNERFGEAIALADGIAAIGRPGFDTSVPGAGSIDVYTGSGATWTKRDGVVKDPVYDGMYGYRVAMSGDIVAGGAYRDDEAAPYAGAVVAVRLDYIPPTIEATVTPSETTNGWHTTSPTVSFTCADEGSGIASCTPPMSVSGERNGYTVSGVARDRAGNTTVRAVTVRVDLYPPSLQTHDPSLGTGTDLPAAIITGTVSDAYSGVAGVTVRFRHLATGAETTRVAGVRNGTWRVPTLGLPSGPTAASATATDVAGHAATGSEVRFLPVA